MNQKQSFEMWADLMRKAALSKLFMAEDRRIDKIIEDLTNENNSIIKRNALGFIHEGEFYFPRENRNILPTNKDRPALSFKLAGRAFKFTQEKQAYEIDVKLISQTLYRLSSESRNAQDFWDAMPECVKGFIDNPDLKKLPRTRECTYQIQGDEMAMRQYHRILPKMEFYSVTNMIY